MPGLLAASMDAERQKGVVPDFRSVTVFHARADWFWWLDAGGGGL